MAETQHLTRGQLDAGLSAIRESPRDCGVVEMIVRRPDIETREVLDQCRLDSAEGLVGDNWLTRGRHLEQLCEDAATQSLDMERVMRETDRTNLMEGLYIKVEENGVVSERYKFVRAGFLTAVFQAEGHWLHRPIIPNRLCEGVNLFGNGDA